jgi:hypothetical protein
MRNYYYVVRSTALSCSEANLQTMTAIYELPRCLDMWCSLFLLEDKTGEKKATKKEKICLEIL